MNKKMLRILAVLALLSVGNSGLGQMKPAGAGPDTRIFARRGNVYLKACVFSPQGVKVGPPRAAIVLFYGGGWVAGEPSWAFGRAQHFAERGMVAVAAQYRLSDQKEITPLDAVEEDARRRDPLGPVSRKRIRYRSRSNRRLWVVGRGPSGRLHSDPPITSGQCS